jgi:hypothetical protein
MATFRSSFSLNCVWHRTRFGLTLRVRSWLLSLTVSAEDLLKVFGSWWMGVRISRNVLRRELKNCADAGHLSSCSSTEQLAICPAVPQQNSSQFSGNSRQTSYCEPSSRNLWTGNENFHWQVTCVQLWEMHEKFEQTATNERGQRSTLKMFSFETIL